MTPFTVSLAMLAACSFALPAHAQLVQVAPGYVKAPFVRVYWGPDGSYVRAPFVSIYSGHGPGYYVHEARPDEFAGLDWLALHAAVRDWNAQLNNDLALNPSGDFWKQSLKTTDIAVMMAGDLDVPPPEDMRRQLRTISDTFESVASSPDVNGVTQLKSFQMLRAALREYTTPQDLRTRRQLALASRDLDRALQRYETGPGWREYLMTRADLLLSQNRLESNEAPPPTAELSKALEMYDSIAGNEHYHVISQLSAFARTRNSLALYIKQLELPSSSPPREELPEPRS